MEAPRHESRDIHAGRVAWVIGAIALVVLLTALLSPVLLRAFGARDLRGAIVEPREKPRYLAPDLHAQLLEYQRAKHAELERYAWEDGTHRYARVPVEVAMRAMTAAPGPATATAPATTNGRPTATTPANAILPATAAGPGWHPRPGQALPLALEFRDESGRELPLSSYFGRPVALVFGYFSCRGLCPEVFRGAREALEAARRGQSAPALLAVSIDARDGAAAARERRDETLGGAHDVDAHFLTDVDGSAAKLARAAGFGFRYDAASAQFAHPAGMVLVDGRGVIRDYLYGVRFDPARLARFPTSTPELSPSPAASPLRLLCFHFDPATGRYDLAIGRILALACTLTVLALLLWVWRERRRA